MKTILGFTNRVLPTINIAAALLLVALSPSAQAAEPPSAGDEAPNFTLRTLDDRMVELQQVATNSTVVLVALRGWPGYQCPICTRQVHDFVEHAADFANLGAKVLMVYPGPADNLKTHAQEFLKDKTWPKDFLFVIDPDYKFTTTYCLRWEAKNETAYPSTFVIDRRGKVRFAHVSKTHGDRVGAATALEAVQKLK